jgi:hypothetical protein
MKTTKQMFGKLAYEMRRDAERELEELRARQFAADAAGARLDAPISRREVLEAIREVRNHFGGNGLPEQEALCDAFDRLADALS